MADPIVRMNFENEMATFERVDFSKPRNYMVTGRAARNQKTRVYCCHTSAVAAVQLAKSVGVRPANAYIMQEGLPPIHLEIKQ